MQNFVNSNASNVTVATVAQQQAAANDNDFVDDCIAAFAAQVQHDSVDDSAYPVLVYSNSSKLVAWYDAELYVGFVQQ